MRRTSPRTSLGSLIVGLATLLGVVLTAQPVAAAPNPPYIAADSGYLASVNYYRAMAGLGPVTEDATLMGGAANHSCYMLNNGIAHDEIPGRPGYTPEGDAAGNSGNVAVTSDINATTKSFVDLWMTGPFHAIGVLRPNLQRVGYGECRNQSTPSWRSGATLDVLHGLGPKVPQARPILFPGNGTTTSLYKFIAESPSPISLCRWKPSTLAGLPVIAMMPSTIKSRPSATFVGPNGKKVPVCVLTWRNTKGTARAILKQANAVVVVPKAQLATGVQTVTIKFSRKNIVRWSFIVDPSAATAVVSPQSTSAIDPSSLGWEPITPARFVDSRITVGATPLMANTIKRVKLADRLGVPAEALAVSGRVMVANTGGASQLTMWNCSNPMPKTPTLTFNAADLVSNSISVPLDPQGYVCVSSTANTDLVIDVYGYFTTTATSRLAAVAPARLLDTVAGVGVPVGPLGQGTTTELAVTSAPEGATGVQLNITTVGSSDGVIVAPCGVTPLASSAVAAPGRVLTTSYTVALSSNSTLCVTAPVTIDVTIDLVGFMAPAETGGFTAAAPVRWMDSRLTYSPQLNGGTGGAKVAAGQVITLQVAGQRNVPATATAVSVNVTAINGAVGGSVTVYACDTTPATVSVSGAGSKAISNAVMVNLSATGTLCVTTSSPTEVLVDLNGWWS